MNTVRRRHEKKFTVKIGWSGPINGKNTRFCF